MKNKDGLILAGVAAGIYFASKMQNNVEGIGRITNKAFNDKVYKYILDAIDGEGYGIKLNTDKEKLQFLYTTFINESGYNKNRENQQTAMANWFSGLPSAVNIDYQNYRILELAKEWGSIPNNATEKQEDKILDNWWNFMAAKTIQLIRKYKIA